MLGDQLQLSIQAGEVFQGFCEPEYSFMPTFKVLRQKGTVHKKQRSPAYCDRILWKVQPYLQKYHPVAVKEIYGVEDMSTSDHKPVRGVFDIKLVEKPDFRNVTIGLDVVAQITLTNVRAMNICASDITGKSDPYIVFNMVPKDAMILPKGTKHLVSKRKDQTLNPVYSDTEIPVLVTKCTSFKELQETVLVLSLWDYDMADPDDDLGDIVISFAQYTKGKESHESFTFMVEQNIVHNTKRTAGKMSFQVAVDWVSSYTPAPTATSGGCCTIS